MKEDLTVTIDENVKLKETVARAEASNDYLQNQQNSVTIGFFPWSPPLAAGGDFWWARAFDFTFG